MLRLRGITGDDRAGKRQMMVDTTAALGNGLLVGKDAAELGDHVNAVLHERCSAGNGMCMCTPSLVYAAAGDHRTGCGAE